MSYVSRPLKRQRTQPYIVQARSNRPISKSLVSIDHDMDPSQQQFELTSISYPCTIVGLRWDLAFSNGDNSPTDCVWAIVRTGEGNNPNTISRDSQSTTYEPEQNVMAFGVLAAGRDKAVSNRGDTKAMRKMQAGDKLWLVCKASGSGSTRRIGGVVQFFCKT